MVDPDRRDRALRIAIREWISHRPAFTGSTPEVAAGKMVRDFLSIYPEHSDVGREVILDRISECCGYHSIDAMLAKGEIGDTTTLYLEQRDKDFV